MIKIESKDKLIDLYKSLASKHKGISTLKDLSEDELYIWIAAKTLDYGRDFKSSLENAASHLENKGKAITSFSVKM